MVCCWWCTLEIEKETLNMPYRRLKNYDRYSTRGCYCSWNCMKASAFALEGQYMTSHIQDTMYSYYQDMNRGNRGKTKMYKDIKRSLAKESLEKYGGTLTPEEYRKGSDAYWVSIPDTINTIQYVEKKKKVYSGKKSKGEEMKLMNDINEATGTVGTLKLRRPKKVVETVEKPIKNLQTLLGIKVKESK